MPIPDVALLFRARQTLLWVVSREELRVERAIAEAAAAAKFLTVLWDCSSGTTDPAGRPVADGRRLADPEQAVAACAQYTQRSVWVFRDLTPWLGSPTTVRALKNAARDLQTAKIGQERTIVVLSSSSEVPESLRGMAHVIEWPLPDRAEVGKILDTILRANIEALRSRPDAADRVAVLEADSTNGRRELAIDAAVGLTASEIGDCYARSLVAHQRIDPDVVRKDKASVISASKVLEWYEPDPRGLDAIGGLELLKDWLRARRSAFGPAARAFGLPAPKGLLLVGVPGCGKSLTAKAIATAWEMPLLRLDLGGLRSKYVGESEGNIRRALRTAESVAPCVLWLDEIEKAITTGPAGDGGVSADALGTILTWLQERAGSVFCVATSNDVSGLPPELLRKGRFDDIFWVDLPTHDERAAVLVAALRAHGRNSGGIALDDIAERTRGFTGAELAALVPDALFRAFADGSRALVTEDLTSSAELVVPLSKTAAEKIDRLREWANGRARPASAPEGPYESIGRALDL